MTLPSNYLFDRVYELTIGNAKEPKEKIRAVTSAPLASDFTVVTLDAISLTKPRMAARITSTKEARGASIAPCTISLYNLAPSTKAKIQQGYSVQLKAGYRSQGYIPLLFSGQIVNTFTRRQGADLITEIICGDASFAISNFRIGGAIPKYQTYLDVLNQMLSSAKDFGTPVAKINTTVPEAERLNVMLDKGYSYDGFLFKELAKVCEEVRYRSYMSLGTLHVEPRERPTTAKVIQIRPENIKGQVQAQSSTNRVPDTDNVDKTGIKLITFLDGRIALPRFIDIVDREDYNGTYQPTEVTHTLDTEGKPWDTEITLLRHQTDGEP